MSIIDFRSPLRLLVSVKGHPYPRDAFFSLFEDMPDVAYTAVEQPASQVLMTPSHASDYDAIVFYDMPGIDFSTQPPELVPPSETFKHDFLALLEQGKGMVFLHHAIAGWPLWPEYGEIIGGRFLYLPAEVRGQWCSDSGYRHAVDHTVRVLQRHPVTEGLVDQFSILDELYLYQVFADRVEPLLGSNFRFDRSQFYSAQRAVNGEMYTRDAWQPGQGSDLVGWVTRYGRSPIVYLQMGDGVTAYENASFRQLLENAVRWVTSPESHQWAAG